MPYVAPDPNRQHLDPYIDNLVAKVLAVKSQEEYVSPQDQSYAVAETYEAMKTLAHEIKTYKPSPNYWYQFQGDLNYCCTETLIRILLAKPEFKYWMQARIHGLCLGVANTFERLANCKEAWATSLHNLMLFDPGSELFDCWYDELPSNEPEKLWSEILRYVYMNLAWRTMPNYKHGTLESVAGVFMDMPMEFYRRFTRFYEVQKMGENGDVSYGKLFGKFFGVWWGNQKRYSPPGP